MKYFLKSFSIILFLLIQSNCFGQTLVSGNVIDQNTGDPVPYAYVKKKETNRGAITNEDGYFQLMCKSEDTLIISFVSYEKIEIPASYFNKTNEIFLKQSNNELATIEIFANFDYLYDVFDKSRKALKRMPSIDSKTYFSLETTTEGIPVELLECYYNAQIGPSGINNIALKNGRIGISQLENTYFSSLNTTEIISEYRLFNKRDNHFPDNALQLSKKALKKHYNLKLISFKNDIYKIQFQPIQNSNKYFKSTVWIDKNTSQIIKIDLSQKKLAKHPFVPIDSQHKMDSVNFKVSYTFSSTVEQSLDRIEFEYSLNYDNGHHNREMNSKGVFLFFEKQASFDLPYYSETSHILSDYDKIVSQPYNADFWRHNEVLSPSKKSKAYKKYFQMAGILVNFDILSNKSDVFKNRLVEWSEKRILLSEINEAGNFQVTVKKDAYNAQALSKFYNLKAHIYLDRNVKNDTIYYLSKTLIDLEDSFYHLAINKNTVCMVNTYYDLVEIGRQRMMEVLEMQYWTKAQADSIYQSSQKELKLNLKLFLSEVRHGENDEAVNRFIIAVKGNLGVDNSLLIWSDYMAAQMGGLEEYNEPWVKLYNYGTALMQIGEYKKAMPYLLKAYSLNSEAPWLLYNMGLNYIKLDNIEKGCEFLAKSKALGEKIPLELISECE